MCKCSIADLYEYLDKKTDSDLLKKWTTGPLKKVLNYNKIRLIDTKIKNEQILDLLTKLKNKQLTPRSAEFVLRELVTKPENINKIIKKLGFDGISEKELKTIIKEVLKTEKSAVEDYKQGKQKSLQFLIGQVIRKTKGQGNAKEITKIIIKELGL